MEDIEDKDLYLRYLMDKKQRLQQQKSNLEQEFIELMLQEEKIKLQK